MATEHACAEPVDLASVRFHPRESYGEAALQVVGGHSLDGIVAMPTELPIVGAYIPQVRFRRPHGLLPKRAAYGIRLDQIMRQTVKTADEVRAFAGIPEGAALVLLCFADDAVLEDLWNDASRFRSVAAGGWDVITGPSYSLWHRRPRPLHFHSLKRSYLAFEAFQEEGATAIPRADFIDTCSLPGAKKRLCCFWRVSGRRPDCWRASEPHSPTANGQRPARQRKCWVTFRWRDEILPASDGSRDA